MAKSLFNRPTIAPAGRFQKDDAAIEKEQAITLGPIAQVIAKIIDSVPGFAEGLTNNPTAAKAQWDEIISKPGGKLGTALGSFPFELVAPIAVAVGGGANLPKLRETAVQNLKTLANSGAKMPEYFNDAMTYMLEKYPRILAHTTNIGPSTNLSDMIGNDGSIIKGSNSVSRTGKNDRLSQIKLTADPIGSKATPDTFFHENWHTVQRRSPENFTKNYNRASERVGYQKNPYEVDARAAGEKHSARFNEWRNDYNPAIARIDPKYLDPDVVKYPKDSTALFHPMFDVDKWNKREKPALIWEDTSDVREPRFNPMQVPEWELDPDTWGNNTIDWDYKFKRDPLIKQERQQLPIKFPETK